MQYPLLSEYVGAITQASENLDQLKHLEVVQDEHGEPYRSSGAFAVVFKMRDPHTERFYALKCFTDEQIERAEAYRKIEEELEMVGGSYFTSMRYYERELFVDSSVSRESEFPVLLMDWVEGETMDLYIREHYQDSYAMAMLCYRFCRLATYLRSQPFAHGDVKPDNIIVSPRGALTLIDYDGMFVPVMAGDSSPTLGTEEFRHPLRTAEQFDATIDDFALASIALSLRAIALEPKLFEQFGAPDRLLFSASDYLDLAQSSVMQAIWSLTSDRDLSKLVALFVLAHAEQSLAATSFQLFAISRPEKPTLLAPPSTKVTDEDLAEAYTDEYGVKFSPDRKRLLKAHKGIILYTIPNSVTAIGDEAFSGCDSLTQITIPDSVTSIGNNAFQGCTSLTQITIPESVTSIGELAFAFCSSLSQITIPRPVYSIGENPFAGLKIELKNLSPHFLVEDNVLFSADKKRLISYCSTQSSYCIPNSVTSIGKAVFFQCTGLSQINIPDSVSSIGNNAFQGCTSLTQITIPDSVTSIGEFVFNDCSNLSQITIPDSVSSFGKAAFQGCSSLTQITIPDSATSIGNWTFNGCSNLSQITIPDSVTSIGEFAFNGCSNLSQITIPRPVYSIGENPFAGLKIELKNLSPHFLVEDNVLFSADKKRLISYCSTQSSYCIPNSVTSIGKAVFFQCTGLSQINIPDSVTSIGELAFAFCSSLSQITIPRPVYSIGENPFAGLKIELKNLSPHFLVEDNVLFTADKKRLISYCSTQSSYCIPSSVTAIGDKAFLGCRSLTQITIPSSVTAIGDKAFLGCRSLTQITIPDSVTSIGEGAFTNCSNLTQITIPDSVTSIGNWAFSGCSSLKSPIREKLREKFGGRIF
ncbi:leucine-rich repeat protein [Porphyromonas endodontalis]